MDEQITDYEQMTDEDFMKQEEPSIPDENGPPENNENEDDPPTPENNDDLPENENSPENSLESENGDKDSPEDSDDRETPSVEPENDDPPAEPEKSDDKETPSEKEESEIDYKAVYEKLLAPFKANGQQVTPKSAEDIIRLAQMGLNYHDKMAGMKPARRALKLLENNDLLKDEDISFLIDVKNGNPEAIKKLLKQHNMNPVDIDIEADTDYTPTDHSVSDAELELDAVLANINTSPNYTKTINTVTTEWDESSQTEAANNPQIIQVINEHMDNGIYDKVSAQVKYERGLGNLAGVNDLDAYKLVGTHMEEQGLLGPAPKADTPSKEDTPKTSLQSSKESETEKKRRQNKKSASISRESGKGKGESLPADFNPLSLSDEEFANFDPSKLGIK